MIRVYDAILRKTWISKQIYLKLSFKAIYGKSVLNVTRNSVPEFRTRICYSKFSEVCMNMLYMKRFVTHDKIHSFQDSLTISFN